MVLVMTQLNCCVAVSERRCHGKGEHQNKHDVEFNFIPKPQVPPGGAVLVEGPSGCGKSTLVRALVGLHPRERGACQLPPPGQVRLHKRH